MDDTKLTVLRLSHRKERDKRITTHVFLVARAFGATSGIYTGDEDQKLEENVKEITKKWGNTFSIQHARNYRRIITDHPGISIHLTMYGHSHLVAIPIIKRMLEERNEANSSILVIVGGKKVPVDVYKISDFNVAIGFQPHSEVAALAIFLYDFLGPKIPYIPRKDAMIALKGGEKARGKMDALIRQSKEKNIF